MIIIPIILLILAIAYLLAIRGRNRHPGLKQLQGWSYAHRGLHDDQLPENSMAAFKAALDGGYGIELDVHLLADGNLAVIHDAALIRTTGQEGFIEDLTTQQLKDYPLEGTTETIPEFRQVMALFEGKAPMIIELKAERGNYAKLTETVCKMLEDYKGVYCLESFDSRCIYWLRKNRPQLIRGQLAENFFASKSKMPGVLKWFLTCHVGNFLCKPDFIAYKFADRKMLGTRLCRKLHKMQGVTWTLKSQEEYDAAVQEGWIPIFEGFTP